jgi:regulator of replication initiation timing
MDCQLLEELEQKIESFLERYSSLKQENELLCADNKRYEEMNHKLKARLGIVLEKLEKV